MVLAERGLGPLPEGARHGAIGVLCRGDELLVVRRAPQVRGGGRWCFPGGHVEPGETSREAVVRELREELGLLVAALVSPGRVSVPETAYVLDVWLVRHLGGRLVLKADEIAECAWMTPEAIHGLADTLPSTLGVLDLLRG